MVDWVFFTARPANISTHAPHPHTRLEHLHTTIPAFPYHKKPQRLMKLWAWNHFIVNRRKTRLPATSSSVLGPGNGANRLSHVFSAETNAGRAARRNLNIFACRRLRVEKDQVREL